MKMHGMKCIRFALLAAATAHVGSLFAYDTYYWVDSGNHDMAAAANWRLNSATGEVPATFPPTLDTATSGSTHPLLRVPAGSTLSLPNSSSLTVNWLGVIDANADCTIDLGSASKTLYLFGGSDAAMWIGYNSPNGQKVLFRSGTIAKYDGTVRRNNIRIGAAVGSRGALASFIADGPSARISNMQVSLDSGNVLFCLTNGATHITTANNAIFLSTGVSNATYRVAGAGSLFAMSNGNRALMIGDAAPANPPVRSGSSFEVLDGGVVSNVYGAVGNNSGWHRAVVDNATWYVNNTIGVGSGANADFNRLEFRNNAKFLLAPGANANNNQLTIGGSGHGNILSVSDSEFIATTVHVGRYRGSSDNRAVFTNATLSSSMQVLVGGRSNEGGSVASTNNAAEFVDCELGSESSPALTIIAGSGMDACSNRVDLVRTRWYPKSSYMAVGGEMDSSSIRPTNQCYNVMRLDRSLVSFPANYFYLGRNGDYNRLELANASTVSVANLVVGFSRAGQALPTISNSIRIGEDSLVEVSQNMFFYPKNAKMVLDDGTFRAVSVINWHYYYSESQGKVMDTLAAAEADGVTFDTEIEFKGSHPRFESTNAGRSLGFDASVHLSFALPESPYAEAAIYGAYDVSFVNVASYSFNLDGVGLYGGKYTIAEAARNLTVGTAELERMNAALPSTRKAKIYVEGKKLVLRVGSNAGLAIIFK